MGKMILRFPRQPRDARHLYAICRFDGFREGSDPLEAFVLTRGYWDEATAQARAGELNAAVADSGERYFVLPVRVRDGEE